MIKKLQIETRGYALCEITSEVCRIVDSADISEGLCTVYIQHTSASLLIQENADPSAKYDLEQWMRRNVPENDPAFTHTHEGADDMPSHIKSALTSVSLGIPIVDGRLALGRWQGVYVWEHRRVSHMRQVLVCVSHC